MDDFLYEFLLRVEGNDDSERDLESAVYDAVSYLNQLHDTEYEPHKAFLEFCERKHSPDYPAYFFVSARPAGTAGFIGHIQVRAPTQYSATDLFLRHYPDYRHNSGFNEGAGFRRFSYFDDIPELNRYCKESLVYSVGYCESCGVRKFSDELEVVSLPVTVNEESFDTSFNYCKDSALCKADVKSMVVSKVDAIIRAVN